MKRRALTGVLAVVCVFGGHAFGVGLGWPGWAAWLLGVLFALVVLEIVSYGGDQ